MQKLDEVLDASRFGTLETVVDGVGIVRGADARVDDAAAGMPVLT